MAPVLAKYSFLMPAWKGAFLKEALYSIQTQTYQDYTVIISDDCSPEPIYDIVQPFLSDSRFHYRRNDSNIGAEHLVDHWNHLLEGCQSPYLIIAGDDDLYEPTFLEKMDELITKYPDTNLARSRMDIINSARAVTRTEAPKEEFEGPSSFAKTLFDRRFLHSVGNYVFNTKGLKSAGGFKFFPLAWFSDDATALIASSNGVSHSSEVLFHFRISGLNISSLNAKNDKLKARATILFYKWFRKNLGTQKVIRITCRDYCCRLLWSYWDGLQYGYKIRILQTFPKFGWEKLKYRWEKACS